MCEFARGNPENIKEPPMCDFTKKRCTLCIIGNKDNYNKAKMVQVLPPLIKSIKEKRVDKNA